ncbi:MAG: NUDIX hydrolase [Chloroflexi bacterium]|nr:NUDIX hydrolase [Chloroflexota bacterium]MCL5109675.1 NUDIX hydrolase [Chloroflexota bacterium]
MPDQASPEQTIESRYVYRGRVIDLRVDTVRLPDGQTTKREIVEHRGAVAMLPLDEQGNVIFVRQYRKPAERYLLEIPAGTREAGEPVEVCLHRELREETGLTAGKVERLAGYYSAVGFCTEFIEVFLVRELSQGGARTDEDEIIEIVPVPVEEALAMVESGEIIDAKTIVGLLTLRARGLA